MTVLGRLEVNRAFTRGRSSIPNTIFKAGDISPHTSIRNQTPYRGMTKPMAVLSLSISKGISLLKKTILSIGVNHADHFYQLELKRPNGSMVIEYDYQNKVFYHSCSAQGSLCYHIFMAIAAIQLVKEPKGEFASYFNKLDFSKTITDEENFFKCSDALYFDTKEHYDHADIVELDKPRLIVDDLTSLLHGKSVKAKGKSPKAPKLATFTWEKDELSDEAKHIMNKNEEELKGKVLGDKLTSIAEQLVNGKVLSVLFMGDAGTSKTTSARLIARDTNTPVRIQNYSLNSEELDILGGYVPSANGGFEWIDGQLTKTFREGGIYVADEFNFAKAGVLGVLNNMLDGVGQIVLRNGEVVERHPNFRFIACINVGYAGTQRLNPALINRFNRVMLFDSLSVEKQLEIIKSETGYTNEAVIRKMIECADVIRQKIKDESIDGAAISIRNLINWAHDIQETGDILLSAWPTMVWAVKYDDEDVQREIFEDVIQPRFQGVRP